MIFRFAWKTLIILLENLPILVKERSGGKSIGRYGTDPFLMSQNILLFYQYLLTAVKDPSQWRI